MKFLYEIINSTNIKSHIDSLLTLQLINGQQIYCWNYVDDFSGDICYNGSGTWSYEEHGRDRVTWINLFTSW